MSLEQALSPIQQCNAPDISIKHAIVKAVRQIYEDMASAGGDFSVAAGTNAAVPDGGGTVVVGVVESPTGTFTVNLSLGE